MPSSTKPLSQIRVFDLSQGIAGPTCGMHLAEYGARVIKLEPPEGDWGRPLGAPINGMSGMSFMYNRGKESLGIDLKAPAGIEAARKLAARSDVFIQSARPGAMEKLGLGFEEVRRLRPNVVYVSVSGYGMRGPNRSAPMTDTVAQAFAGLMAINRGRDGVPHKIDTTIVDNVTGLYAFQATVMALWGRTSETPAEHVDVSLLQSAAALQSHMIADYSARGRSPEALNPPAGTFPTLDGWIAVTLTNEEHFKRICRALEREDIQRDSRFATFADRRQNLPALIAMLDAIYKTRTTAGWLARLKREDILASPVNDYGALLADAQVLETDVAPALAATPTMSVRAPRTPNRAAFTNPTPQIGEHSRRILAELGLSRAEIDALIAKGVVKETKPEQAS